MSTIILSIGIGISAFLITYLIKLIFPYLNVKNDSNIHIYYKDAYNNWYSKGKSLPTFTFDNFLQFYNLNPKEWQIMDTDGKVVLPARKVAQKVYYGFDYDFQPIFFTNMFEYKKYRDWAAEKVKEMKKEKNNENRNKAEKAILEAVQKDMDSIQQTEDELTKIINNNPYNYTENCMMTNTGEANIERTYCGIDSNGKRVRIVKQYIMDKNGNLRDLGIKYYEKWSE